MTSLSVCALGVFVFLVLRKLEEFPGRARRFFWLTCGGIVSLLLLLVVHSVVNFSEHSLVGTVIKGVGRDMTLTGRTFIWHDMYQIAEKSSLLGVGYGGFWIGRVANIPWNSEMTWVLGQGHNGYIDTYLQIGWLGLALFAAWLVSVIVRVPSVFEENPDFGRFRMTFVAVILFVNITESTFLRGDHNLWLLFLIATLSVPLWQTEEAAVEEIDVESIEPEQCREEPAWQ
jgi:O-antigen ligase